MRFISNIKTLFLIKSKFVCLQKSYSSPRRWETIDPNDGGHDPYYICVLFSNGFHLPLPLVLGEREYNNQRRIIKYYLPDWNYRYVAGLCQEFILSEYRKMGILETARKECIKYLTIFNV